MIEVLLPHQTTPEHPSNKICHPKLNVKTHGKAGKHTIILASSSKWGIINQLDSMEITYTSTSRFILKKPVFCHLLHQFFTCRKTDWMFGWALRLFIQHLKILNLIDMISWYDIRYNHIRLKKHLHDIIIIRSLDPAKKSAQNPCKLHCKSFIPPR